MKGYIFADTQNSGNCFPFAYFCCGVFFFLSETSPLWTAKVIQSLHKALHEAVSSGLMFVLSHSAFIFLPGFGVTAVITPATSQANQLEQGSPRRTYVRNRRTGFQKDVQETEGCVPRTHSILVTKTAAFPYL